MSPTTYSGASCSSVASRPRASSRGTFARASASTSSTCCATEKMCSPLVCPFQRATRARPWAMSSISTSSGEGPCSFVLGELDAIRMTETRRQMVVDHADRLHEGVDDGRADEFESAAGQLFRHLARDIGLGRNLPGRLEVVHLRRAVDEVPQQRREAGALLH